VDVGVTVAVALVNELTPGQVRSRPMPDPIDRPAAAARAVAAERVTLREAEGLAELAAELRPVFGSHVDRAATTLNGLLARFPATPVLSKEDGEWRLHQHPVDVGLVAEWAAICGTDLARLLGAGEHGRLGVCEAPACDRVFVDTSKNGSRRFCSTPCQNRVKAATFRHRRAALT
jgi:predicted RNA-binding Zn ribbon-like protein